MTGPSYMGLTGALVIALAGLLATAQVIPTKCPKVDAENHTVQLAHEIDCTKFYKCNRGQKILMECPKYNEDGDRLYFNATLQLCDWPENVDCKLSKPAAAIQFRAQIPTKCPKEDSKDHSVQLAHESDCTKYYACDHGHKIPMDCPAYNAEGDRLFFNASLQVCDWPANVDCKLLRPVAAVQFRAEIPTKCPKHDSKNNTVHLAHESDCTKFYKCGNGVKYVMQCPEYNKDGDRLYFNATSQSCDWPENVDCKLPKPVAAIQFREPIPTKCPKHESKNHTVQLAHESDCTKFYKCNHGQKVLMECPKYNEDGDRLYFNATLQLCDWPENVDCNLPKPIAAIQPKKPHKDEIPTECPKPGSTNKTVQLAHEIDCTKFYTCNGGEKIESQCPVYNEEGDRLHFNPAIQVCDWPENVDGKLPLPIAARTSKAEIPKKCPKRDPEQAVQLAHDYDCTKFYKCDRGKKVLMECPVFNQEGDRLFFNATLQVCDWPENVDCQPSSPGTPATGPSSETPTDLPSSTPLSSSETPTDIPSSTPMSSSETPTDLPSSTPISSSETPTDIPSSTPITSSETPTNIPSSTPLTSSETPTDIPSSTPISSTETSTDIPSTTPSNEPSVYPDPDCVGQCPKVDPPQPWSFLLPHKNCRFFCLCYKQQGYRYVCPDKGHFSETEKVCTDPKDAKCKYGEFAPSTESPTDVILNEHDDAIMNILGFNDRFRW